MRKVTSPAFAQPFAVWAWGKQNFSQTLPFSNILGMIQAAMQSKMSTVK